MLDKCGSKEDMARVGNDKQSNLARKGKAFVFPSVYFLILTYWDEEMQIKIKSMIQEAEDVGWLSFLELVVVSVSSWS